MKKSLIILLLASLGTSVLADYRIEMRSTMADPAMASFKMTQITYTKGKRQRIEDISEMAGRATKMVRLVMCDKEQQADIDTESKIYTLSSLRPDVMAAATNPNAPVKEGTGKMISNFKVQDKGMEKVANYDAHHWWVDQTMKGTGCIGTFDYASQREFWTAKLPIFECPIMSGNWTTMTLDKCKVSQEMSGDVDLYMKANKDQVVKEIIRQDGKVLMTRELVDYSTAELDPALFSLEGYREVSRAEFDKVRQENMMKAYSR